MTVSVVAPPSEEEARSLYERLLANDPTASADLAFAYLDHLTTWLMNRNRQVDEHICATAAEDALLALIKKPGTYKPERQALTVYLHMSASGDLKNLLRSEQRHASRRARLEDVENSLVIGKYLSDSDADPALVLERCEAVADSSYPPQLPDSMRASLTSEEARVLHLMQMKESETVIYASALGISHLSFKEQQRQVKRVKDRLTKRLERSGGDNV